MHRHTHARLPAVTWITIAIGLTASLWAAVALVVMLLLLLAGVVQLLHDVS
jgi:hypothetical protein